jgi:membrane protease YdiL (CAAX protease family)
MAAHSGDAQAMSDPGSRSLGNPFGVWEAALGLVVGFLLSIVAVSVYAAASHTSPSQLGVGGDIADFAGLWAGFVGSAIFASRTRGLLSPLTSRRPDYQRPDSRRLDYQPSGSPPASTTARGAFVEDYGLRLRLWPDLPLGLVLGVGSQYLLVPLLELPLQPIVHNLNQQLGHPAQQLLNPVQYNTFSLVVLTILICVGSPLVEEIFFRGLLLRGLLGRFGHLGRRAGPARSIVVTGLVFGLVHFERLQFLGLAGFGMLLAYVAYRTGRLGPTIIAHVAFNTTTIIAYVLQH